MNSQTKLFTLFGVISAVGSLTVLMINRAQYITATPARVNIVENTGVVVGSFLLLLLIGNHLIGSFFSGRKTNNGKDV